MARNQFRINEENIFIVGDTILMRVEFEIKENNGMYVKRNPGNIKFSIKNPKGSVDTEKVIVNSSLDTTSEIDTITSPEVGVFEIEKRLNYPGQWWIRWEGIGTAEGVSETTFSVVSSGVIG